MVSQFIGADQHAWNVSFIQELFDPEDIQAILSIPLPITPKEDKLIWVLNSKGEFTIKSAYHSTIHQANNPLMSQEHWKKLWKMVASERVRMFLWKLGANVLPTRENMMHRIYLARFLQMSCYQSNLALHLLRI